METTEYSLSEWNELINNLTVHFGKKPDMNAILFLIGVQELGQGTRNFTKEEKQNLMHIAVCKVLSFSGYYELEGADKDGWPHWKLLKKLPSFDMFEQEKILRNHVLEYFHAEVNFWENE